MTKTSLELLECAAYDTIVIPGIGGFVPTSAFLVVFPVIDASTFAKIMYATDQMLIDFEGPECVNPANLVPTIETQDFTLDRHFRAVEDIFRKHFGTETVQREPTP
ncbi:hypothetical protein RXV86_03215 [Alisedimentitalea sp. MJ-SS2]|uniref:hypothetical protein n=1 Tax=Aliisedimentitalea sp. MJ-SS2 TaxID=3049795 RepID=UPI00290915E4|nr:hypothetical protein [Alisedimentitalea sp. MJ-SS2]MDU8926386.1 hypothetical protein [Alisedimentitalea sp. MJ-SS2]